MKINLRWFLVGSFLSLLFVPKMGYGVDQGWSPWFVKKAPQSRGAFTRAIETNDRAMLSVPAELFARTWGGRGMDLPIGPDPASWGNFLRSSEVTEVTCTTELLKTLFLARVKSGTGEVDFALERTACLPGEVFLAWRGVPFVSLGCGNPMKLRVPRLPTLLPPVAVIPPPPPGAPPGCPPERGYYVHVWATDLLSPTLRSRAPISTLAEKDFVGASLSRNLGKELLESGGQASPGSYSFRISWVREGPDHSVLQEHGIEEVIAVGGVFHKDYSRNLTDSDLIIRVIFSEQQSDGRVVGPKKSPRTGQHELRVYPQEWMNGRGGRYCNLHSHVLLVRSASLLVPRASR